MNLAIFSLFLGALGPHKVVNIALYAASSSPGLLLFAVLHIALQFKAAVVVSLQPLKRQNSDHRSAI